MTAKPSQTNLEVHAGWQPGELERKSSLRNYLCFLQMFHYHWDHKEELIKTCSLAWQIMAKKFLCTHLEDQNGCSLLCLCSSELVQTSMCIPDWIGIFKCWFLKRGKPGNPEKNLNQKSREGTNNKLNVHTTSLLQVTLV